MEMAFEPVFHLVGWPAEALTLGFVDGHFPGRDMLRIRLLLQTMCRLWERVRFDFLPANIRLYDRMHNPCHCCEVQEVALRLSQSHQYEDDRPRSPHYYYDPVRLALFHHIGDGLFVYGRSHRCFLCMVLRQHMILYRSMM